ncbi:MAG: cyclodeaminase [Trueperaceae bacterium]
MTDVAAVRTLSEEELRSLVQLDLDVVEAIEACFRALATEEVVMPPIMRLDIPGRDGSGGGEVDVKSAYLPGMDSFAIKISPGFFGNPQLGLPSLNGLMVLLSAKTGLLQAMLLDNGYLTDVRTAAAGAVAAKWLSREDSRTAGIVGAGAQARLQLEALCLVRPIERALVWARDAARAELYVEEMRDRLGIELESRATVEKVVRESDIVVTTTPSSEPLVQGDWLEPGVHLTAMGSDAEHKNELDPSVLLRAHSYACDRLSQCRTLGELHHALAAGVVSDDQHFAELGEIIAGKAQGRSGSEQITVCDLTGTGAQDSAIAALAFARAVGSTMSNKTMSNKGSRFMGDHIPGRVRPKKERA